MLKVEQSALALDLPTHGGPVMERRRLRRRQRRRRGRGRRRVGRPPCAATPAPLASANTVVSHAHNKHWQKHSLNAKVST